MVRDLFLAIDVGTGGIRSALVNHDGEILKICHKEHEQIVPRYGWSEQRPENWWVGTIETIKQVLSEVDNAQRVLRRSAHAAKCMVQFLWIPTGY